MMIKKTGTYINEKRTKKDISEEELAKNLNVTVTQLLQGDDAASADVLIMRLLRKVERYKGLFVAVIGLVLTQLPFPARFAAESAVGQFISGLVTGVSTGCALVGVCVFAYGLVTAFAGD